jgi:Tfp pilus assembly protein PilF
MAGFGAPAARGEVISSATNVIISVEGRVEVFVLGSKNWATATNGQFLGSGYRLRTGADGRAMVRLSNLSVLKVGERMEYEFEPSRAPGGRSTLSLQRGAAYFFSRDKPREIEIRTPIATGAIRGTEFEVAVGDDGRTRLTMIDGEVELGNDLGTVTLRGGDQGVVEVGRAPVKTSILNAINIIQWTLYYPAVLDPSELELSGDEQAALAESLKSYRAGNLVDALNLYPEGREPKSPDETVYYCELLLSAGLVEQTEKRLNAMAGPSGRSIALAEALRQMVASVKRTAWVGPSPESASEWIASSYYAQSQARLPEALAAARKAVERSPGFGFGWERVAEMEFSFGRIGAARQALDRSLALAPLNAQAVALKGFLFSAENRIAQAETVFDQAIGLDGSLANAWLGRGLCRIRRGKNEAGREDLETAAALEPNRAVLRSYLGKAFSQTGDEARADHELVLAHQFDPNDPTSWLYSALLHQQQNHINEAIRDLEKSELLNNNRRVYRSWLLLDQDAAVRGANLAAIYRDAGMNDVSVREATRAVNADYGNYSAHLFLANSYNELRDPNQINLRYETPWLTEYLIANLLAPVGAGTLSQTVSQQDYSKLFARDGFGVASSTEYFSRGRWVQAGAQYGTFGNSGYAVDTLYRSDNGWRPNNDQQQLTISMQIKQQVTPSDTIFLQMLYYDASAGDLTPYYDQSQAHLALRTKEKQEPLLLAGYHHEWAPGIHTLLLAGRFQDTFNVTDTNQAVLLLARNSTNGVIAVPTPFLPTSSLDYESKLEIYSVEAQQIFELENHTLVVGGRYQTGTFDTRAALGPSTPTLLASTTRTTTVAFATSPLSQKISPDFERVTGYAYYYWRIFEPLLLDGGVACDYLKLPSNFRDVPVSSGEDSERRVSPKAGFTWTPCSDSTVRFGYTRSLGGVSFDQSVRLEPSQVAGFNQAFRSLMPESVVGSAAGARFETFGLAFEQKFKTGTYLGIEGSLQNSYLARTIGSVSLNFPPTFVATGTPERLDYAEKNLLVTLNQLLGDSWSVGARYWLSRAELVTRFPEIPATVSSAGKSRTEATLHQLGLFGLFNHGSGFFARGEALWNMQSNDDYTPALAGDDFWQLNLYGGYRFWQRHAQVQLGVINLTHRDYRLNPLNVYSELPRGREFTASLQFNF